jgi:hypothetical protein
MIKWNDLVIVSMKIHMAKLWDVESQLLDMIQPSFRWRLMSRTRDIGAQPIKVIKLIIATVKHHNAKPPLVSVIMKVESLS